MPWKERDRMSLRLEFVRLANQPGANVAALCRRFGISRKTGYKWLARDTAGGEAALADQSRRPRQLRSPTPEAIERRVLDLRDAHPAWGGRKLHRCLRDQGETEAPAPSTITKILHRHGRIDRNAPASQGPWQRFERSEPNELWQMDFKGEIRTDDGQWCYPLTMTDDCSRYNLLLAACLNQKTETVQGHLTQVFMRYGKPEAMLMDNGNPWSNANFVGGWSKLTVWLIRHDVKVHHGRPYHPQTQGKEERFHRTLDVEVLQGAHHRDAEAMQEAFDAWRPVYNHKRPHEALGMQAPDTHYQPSVRAFSPTPPAIEYDVTDAVRKVNPVGQVQYRGQIFKLSQAFADQRVALRPTATDGVWDVYFCRQRIGQVSPRTGGSTMQPTSGETADADEAGAAPAGLD